MLPHVFPPDRRKKTSFAGHAESANTGRTFVWVEAASRAVVGYFTLAAHLLRRADVPKAVGRGAPDAIPAILLARLALDRSLQGQGLGARLLLDALESAVDASTRAAGRLIAWTPSTTPRHDAAVGTWAVPSSLRHDLPTGVGP